MLTTDLEIEKYCLEHSDDETWALAEINRDTQANVLNSRMLSGHLQGRILAMLSNILQPKYILEIGSYTGYSSICLAEGLKPGGKVITIEANEEFEDIIKKNIALAKNEYKIELKIGKALDIIPTLPQKFDLVFIDADKMNYINYYNAVFDNVNLGGLIISDNVLWDGKVVDLSKKDATTILIREFNKYLKNDNRTQKVLLPIRDGLFVSRKISEI